MALKTDYVNGDTFAPSDINATNTQVNTNETNIGNKVSISDIVDNLTSTNTDKPLSAKQGKTLHDAALLRMSTDGKTSANEFTESGYALLNATEFSDLPGSSGYYWLIVFANTAGSVAVQFATVAIRSNYVVYMRKLGSSSWSDWKSITFA